MGAEDEAEQVRRSEEGGIRGHPKARVCSPRLSEPASAGLWLELLVIVPAGRVPNYSPRRGYFEVQQVQQNHKRPCLQEVSEFLKVQQSATGCRATWSATAAAEKFGIQWKYPSLRMLAGSGRSDRTASNK